MKENKEGYIQTKIELSEKAKFIELSKKDGYETYSFLLRKLIRDYIKKSEAERESKS